MRTLTHLADLAAGDVAVLGVPWDRQSSFLRGAAAGPAAIRAALESPSSNSSTETGPDLDHAARVVDVGDVAIPGDVRAALDAITQQACAVLARGASLLSLGGDHAVTFPLVRACAAIYPDLNVLHLDAHPDLYDVFEGDPYSHACPFARVMEGGLARRLVQVGIRTLNDAQRSQVARFGIEQVHMKDWDGHLALRFDGPVYLSLDLDVLDPAFAPGVSHHEPGGLSVRDVLGIVQRFGGELVGADLVELNPARDRDGVTAMVAAKLARELLARLLSSAPRR